MVAQTNKQTGAAEWSSLSYHGFTGSDLFEGLGRIIGMVKVWYGKPVDLH